MGERFSNLRIFCGGLATPFPTSATVESDFSILRYEKNDHRTNMLDYTLEGRLHCKQFFQLKDLDDTLNGIFNLEDVQA